MTLAIAGLINILLAVIAYTLQRQVLKLEKEKSALLGLNMEYAVRLHALEYDKERLTRVSEAAHGPVKVLEHRQKLMDAHLLKSELVKSSMPVTYVDAPKG
jgi:hypothetical protein